MRATMLFAGLLFISMSGHAAAQPGIAPMFEKGVVYNQVDGSDLKLDFARPAGDGPYPCVICIHGGGFQLGNREDMHPMLSLLVRHGFAAATITYRLTPKHRLPAAIEDAKCAVRFVREKAPELKIDPNRVAALGASAGGMIALMVGLTDSSDGFDGQGHAGPSSSVQAVVNFFAPTHLSVLQPTPEGKRQIRQAYGKEFGQVMADALGSTDRTDMIYQRMSPIRYVRKGGPPVLTLHGTLDPLVGVEQAKMLHAALKSAAIPEQLILLENAGHGWTGADWDRTNQAVIDFLSEQLLTTDPAADRDGKNDANARAVANEFIQALLGRNADALVKLISVPFAVAKGGKLEVLHDSKTVHEILRKGAAADVPQGTQLTIERVFTYQKFLENHADMIKEPDQKQLAAVLQKDDRVLIVLVKSDPQQPPRRLIFLVGWRDGQPRLVGIGA